MGKLCPFLREDGENIECLEGECFLYLADRNNCALKEFDFNRDEKIEEIKDLIKKNSQQKERLIKKIGSILNKSSKSMYNFYDNLDEGNLLLDKIEQIKESLKSIDNSELLKLQRDNFENLKTQIETLIEEINKKKFDIPELDKIVTKFDELNIKGNLKDINQLNKKFYDKIYNLTKNKFKELKKVTKDNTEQMNTIKDILNSINQNFTNNNELFTEFSNKLKELKNEISKINNELQTLKENENNNAQKIVSPINDLKEIEKKTLQLLNTRNVVPELEKINNKFDKLLEIQNTFTEQINQNRKVNESLRDSLSNISEKINSLEKNQNSLKDNIEDKIEDIKKISELQKKFLETENETMKYEKSKEYNKTGLKYMLEGNYQEAIDKFKEAIKINPELWGAFNNLGLAFSHLNKNDKAKSVYKNLINKNPDFAEAHYNLGNIFAEDKIFDSSLEYLNKAIDKKPNFAKAYKAIGDVYEKKDNIEKALEYWKKALEINPAFDDIKAKLQNYDEFPVNENKNRE